MAQPPLLPNQNQVSNPLDQLRDIHLPTDINYFELAPGWWFLIIISIFLMLFYFLRRGKKYHQQNSKIRQKSFYLAPAHKELEQIAMLPASSLSISQLSGLLKRVCLLGYPKQQVASLSGEAWIQFLNQQSQQEYFNHEQQKAFTELMYRKNISVDNQFWQTLIQSSRIVINQILDPKPLDEKLAPSEQNNLLQKENN